MTRGTRGFVTTDEDRTGSVGDSNAPTTSRAPKTIVAVSKLTAPSVADGRSAGRRAEGVEAAVDVDDLARDPAAERREQEQDGVGDGARVLEVPAQRRVAGPRVG